MTEEARGVWYWIKYSNDAFNYLVAPDGCVRGGIAQNSLLGFIPYACPEDATGINDDHRIATFADYDTAQLLVQAEATGQWGRIVFDSIRVEG